MTTKIEPPIATETETFESIRCPEGHPGPFFYVERLEFSQLVETATRVKIIVRGDQPVGLLGVVGERVLECRECCSEIPLPSDCEVEEVRSQRA